MNDKSRRAMFAKGAEPIHQRVTDYTGVESTLTHRCQKCGGIGDSKWFDAHKKTHPNFEKEHHYQIHYNLQQNPQYRLRRHHKLDSHDKYCDSSNMNCQMSHLGNYKGKSYKPFS